LDCPEGAINDDTEYDNGNSKIIINEKGIDIDVRDKDSGLKVKIDSNGINLKTAP
jgi:hypothetical protein